MGDAAAFGGIGFVGNGREEFASGGVGICVGKV
jgi:hypothetical protein